MKLRVCYSENFISLVQKQEIVDLTLFSLTNFYIPKFSAMRRVSIQSDSRVSVRTDKARGLIVCWFSSR